jgi:hypothetical protein
MRTLGILRPLLLLVAIALAPSLSQAQVLEPLCQCFCRDISVLIRPVGGDASLCAETDGLPCFVCNIESTLSACFAIYANPEKAIECPVPQRAPTPVPPSQ